MVRFLARYRRQRLQDRRANIGRLTKVTRLAIKSFLKANKPGIMAHIFLWTGMETRFASFIDTYISLPNSMVRTLLWFKANPEKLKFVGEDDVWIEPSDIVEALLKLCEDPAYKGGTVLESSRQGRTRVVQVLNDPGPSTACHNKCANTALEDKVFERLAKERSSRL